MNNEEKKFITLTPFKLQVIQSFPYIDADFDALTNYELLCKIVEYLNITVDNVNLLSEDVQTLYNYVHDYFDNLDVQEEINKKLDEMALDGSLTNIIKEYLDPIIDDLSDELNNTINSQNETIDTLNGRINSNLQEIQTLNSRMDEFTSLEEGSTSGDAELTDIRVAENGFVYSSAGSSVRNQVKILDDNIESLKNYVYQYIPTELGAIDATNLEVDNDYATNRIRSAVLNLSGEKLIEVPNTYQLNIYEKNTSNVTSFVGATVNGKIQYEFNSDNLYRFIAQLIGSSSPTVIEVKITNMDSIENSLNNLNNTSSDISNINSSNSLYIKNNYEKMDLSSFTTLDDQFYVKQNGIINSATGSKSTMIPVKPGEKYRVYGEPSGNLSVVVYFDSAMKFISSDLDTGIQNYTEITVPDHAYNMSVQTRHSNTYPIDVLKYNKVYAYPFDIMTSLKRTAYIDKKLGYNIPTLSKGYITITVDDGNSDIDVIAKRLQTSYGYPLNLALPPTKLFSAVSNNQGIGTIVLDIAKYVQEHGGEILSHSFTVITESNENNLSTMYDNFSNNKRLLENSGLNVNGIILTGGDGEISDSITDAWVRGYYNYSDRYGDSEPYYHPRINIAKTALDTVKQKIDECANNHTLLHLSFHGLYEYGSTTDGTSVYPNGFTMGDLAEILDYIKTYTDENEIEVVRYGYVYDNYGKYGE